MSEVKAKQILHQINLLLEDLDKELPNDWDLEFISKKNAPTSYPSVDGMTLSVYIVPRSSLKAVKYSKEVL